MSGGNLNDGPSLSSVDEDSNSDGVAAPVDGCDFKIGPGPVTNPVSSQLLEPGSSEKGMDIDGDTSRQGLEVSSAPLPGTSQLGSGGRVASGPMVCFPLVPTFQDDSSLLLRYPHEKERGIATMIRDLQLLTHCHTEGLLSSGTLKTSVVPTIDFPPLGPPLKLSDGFSVLIDTLQMLKQSIISTYEEPNNASGGGAGRKVEFLPNVALWSQWPVNKTGTYLSRLVCRYQASTHNLEKHLVEIADYCLGHHDTLCTREPLFQSDGRLLVLRREMLSMDHYVPIQAAVVNAWVRVCDDTWNRLGCKTRTCLDVVHKVEEKICRHDLVDHWRTWISNFNLPITEAELVYIPCLMYNEYSLLVVNFRRKVIQCIDTVCKSDRTAKDEFALKTVSKFWDLLEKIGDVRRHSKEDFKFEVSNPIWSTSISDPDSGLSVMHLINLHEYPHAASLNVRMDEDHVRTSLRVSICANMVTSRVNLLRAKVLGDVQDYIEKKNNRTIAPSPEVELFRSNFDWLPNF